MRLNRFFLMNFIFLFTGYSKQPPPPNSGAANDPWADFNQTSKGFDSSSDDSDDDTMKRKIKVEIFF